MAKQYVAIIPARYQSTRLPGKPLANIAGKTMIARVFEQTKMVKQLNNVIVATDDNRIIEHCNKNNISVVNTSINHLNGTTRCLEVANLLNLNDNDVVINVQGDEPFISPKQIELLISCFDNDNTEIASLCKQIGFDIDNPNTVKVVKNLSNQAMYFSRSIIPFKRDKDACDLYYKHIGLYAYRYDILKNICMLNESILEKSEKLEQLRWLENGYKIQLLETTDETISVDSPNDLKNAIEYAHIFDRNKL